MMIQSTCGKKVKVCKPMLNGKLGIRCLSRFNSALLGKLLWRHGIERDAL